MAWQNYEWSWKIRGLSVQLKHICTVLADEASASGLIDQLRHHRLAALTELSFDQTRRYIYQLIELGFIKERRFQYRSEGDQRANAYQINFDVFHPPDTTGPALWKYVVDGFLERSEVKEAVKVHSLESEAYYNPRRAVLHVWVGSRRDKSFFEVHRSQAHHFATGAHRRISSFEFIA